MGALMRRVQRNLDPIVLEGGLKFEKIAVNPGDAELTKQFEAQINATCRLLRVPPHKVFLTSDTKYDNLETQDKLYVGDTLIPVGTRFEHRYGKVLLSRKDRLRLFFENDRDEMAIKDTKVQTDRVIRATERGVLTIDEARAALGYNPLPNDAGQIRMVPTNMTMVDENNEVIIAGASTAQGDQPPADEGKADDKALGKQFA
jgi:HK97 family phage portal protein